jgi:Tfp pilus assembly protein PilE
MKTDAGIRRRLDHLVGSGRLIVQPQQKSLGFHGATLRPSRNMLVCRNDHVAHKLHVIAATATGLGHTLPDPPGEVTFLRSLIPRKKTRRGFTVVEALTAAVVAGMAIMLFTAAFPSCSQWVLRSGHVDAATNGCSKQTEYWRGIGYAGLPTSGGAAIVTQTWTPPVELPNATAKTVFTLVDASMSPSNVDTGRCKVEATVTWAGAGSDKGSVTLVGVITR